MLNEPIGFEESVIFKARANERDMFANMLGTTCCVRLYTMLGYVASSLKPVKLFAQYMPTFILFSGDR